MSEDRLSPDEQRLKLAAKLTMQRRINEHARDRARRELDHAERELIRITDDFMCYVVQPMVDELKRPTPADPIVFEDDSAQKGDEE